MSETKSDSSRQHSRASLIGLGLLALLVLLIFHRSFETNQIVFANDGPLGFLNSEALKMPQAFNGYWMDTTWIGLNGKHAVACPTYGLLTLLGPVNFAKYYDGIAVFLVALSAFLFFRNLGLSPALTTVAAIGAAFNSNFFSNTCWGLGSRSITLACIFFALAALTSRRIGNYWLNAMLAGLAVGMAVVEGADNGVIFSLFVAAFVLWQAWTGRDREPAAPANASQPSRISDLIRGTLRLGLVAAFAGFMATQSLISLFDIASKGAVSATASAETKEGKWLFASQWSLPPAETTRVLIPGLYGYRMDTLEGGNYWGRVGESPGAPGSRFSGAGEYAGLLVVLLSLWALGHAFRRDGGPFTRTEKKLILFWAGALVLAVILGWGKYTPLYRLTVYQLPYFSSIRNPMKFMHVAHMALMILFAYGLLGFGRQYLERLTESGKPGAVPARPPATDKRWKYIFIGLLAVSVVFFMAYASNKSGLIKHLEEVGFDNPQASASIASFSVGEVGKFVLFMALSVGALLLVMKGVFAGRRATWASVILGLVLMVDLARANAPWLIYWDYPYKYASNPVIDILKEKPYLNRVIYPPFLFNDKGAQAAGGVTYLFPHVYGIEWVQHHFPYYNIQTVDVAQDPRPPADKLAYMQALGQNFGRYWQLTNTRYVLGMTPFLTALNQQFDPGRNRFQVRTTFNVAPKPGSTPTQMQDFTAVPAPNGPLALFEFTGALPRAKLYAKWQVLTNGDEALKTLADPAFDPWSAVVVSSDIPSSPSVSTNSDGGPVEFTSYHPQRIELKANATAASVLLLNDRFDPDWHVSVDGQPAKLLQANFIMRGVQVPAGTHTVVFEFKPPLKGLKISVAAIAVSLVLTALLFILRQNGAAEPVKVTNAGAR